MKKLLTDEMIYKMLTKSPIPILIIGIVLLIVGVIICIAVKKNSRFKHDIRNFLMGAPFFVFGLLLVIVGIGNLLKEKPTMDSFVVKKCEIVDMYDRALRPHAADKKYSYYIVCDGHKEDIKVQRYEYQNEYRVGDYMYLVVKADDEDYLYHMYWGDEYEYVGSKLVD